MTKEPLTHEEQRILLEAAKKLGQFRYTENGMAVDAYKSVALMLATGIHPSVLTSPKSEIHTERRADGLKIVWNRPKKKGREARTVVPALDEIAPWVEGFLKEPRPGFRQFYNAMLSELAELTGNEAHPGLQPSNLSPLALRHTFGVNLAEAGVSPADIAKAMNCSDKMLKFYLKYSSGMLSEKMRSIKLGSQAEDSARGARQP